MYIEGCGPLPDLAYGDVIIEGQRVGDLYVIGSYAIYFCDKGFELDSSGMTTRYCVHDNNFGIDWSDYAPFCIRVCKYDLISLFGLIDIYIQLYTINSGWSIVYIKWNMLLFPENIVFPHENHFYPSEQCRP